MARPLRLEVFEAPERATPPVELAQLEFEEVRLQAYEQGYTAGWDDAVAAQDAEVARLRADLGRSLEDLSFTYHEAHSHVLRSLEPLLHDMVTKVLPALARESLGHVVLDHLRPLARDLAGAPIVVVVNPVNCTTIERLLVAEADFPLIVQGEPSLGEGQVHLKLGEVESHIDLDGVIAALSAAVSNFLR
ncbi:MAG: flagellar biosynthesis protein, partial [Albidovulum sp.]